MIYTRENLAAMRKAILLELLEEHNEKLAAVGLRPETKDSISFSNVEERLRSAIAANIDPAEFN